ncbi:unnamed protein product [Calypogeia fissa]
MATDPPNGPADQNLQVILASVSPILTQLPKWIELGAYLEFGDDEVRLCEGCHNVCEWVYFKLLQFNADGLELCGSCMEKYKKPTPWTLYVREGLILFLGTLNAGPASSAKSPVGLDVKANNELQVPASVSLPSPSKSGSPAHSFDQNSPSGQLQETCNFEPVPQSAPLLLTTSSEPLNVAPTTEPLLLKADSEPVLFSSSSEQVIFSPSAEPVLFNSDAEPVQFTTKSDSGLFALSQDPVYFASNPEPLHFTSDPETALFPPTVEQGQFTSHADPTLLTSSSEPVLFTSNAEPVHFISHSKPALFSPNPEPVLFTPYPESEAFSDSLGHIPKSEPLRFTPTSDSMPFSTNLDSLPKALQVVNHEPMQFPSNSGTLATTPNFELSQSKSKADVPTPPTENLVRTQSKSGKKVSDGTLVDRMRTIVQQDCRLGKDLFTTGIELAERYNSCYKHETIHVRRVFEAMKTLGYTASKDTMQVQVQKVRRKVKLIYGLAMK